MILCKNCAHFRAPAAGLDLNEYAKCANGRRMSPVTGELSVPSQSSIYCITVRASDRTTDCGPDARFFEARVAEVAA